MTAQIITHGGDEKDDVSDGCTTQFFAEGVPEEICPAPDRSFIFVDEK